VSTIQKAEELLSLMTKGEKTQLLQRVARDLGDASPGIDVTPGVCGGTPCIVRTRMPVWVLVQAKRLRSTEADMCNVIPHCALRTWLMLGLIFDRTERRLNSKYVKTRQPENGTVVC